MPIKGFRSRVTDFFNANITEFIALTDAELMRLDGSEERTEHSFLAVSTRHVMVVTELGGDEDDGDVVHASTSPD